MIDALQRLGDTPDAVAARLRECGIEGSRFSAVGCPVARYLHNEGVGDTRLYVLGNVVHTAGETTTLPPAVVKFIKAFDGGEYPDLERT